MKATQNQEERSRIRKEIQESKKKSAKLSELISLEEENYQLASAEVAASSSATTAQQTSFIEESDYDSAESDSNFEDPLHAVRTPRKISEIDSPSSPTVRPSFMLFQQIEMEFHFLYFP